uniref:Uncharacterized protein n=1 Tax=Anguilla anguilla TaxID=7936 RepID=A0A0E9QYT9_ANGAN
MSTAASHACSSPFTPHHHSFTAPHCTLGAWAPGSMKSKTQHC